MTKCNELVATYSFGGGTKPFSEYLLRYLNKKLKEKQEKEKASKN